MNGRESLAQTVTLLSFVSAGMIAVANVSMPSSQSPDPSPSQPSLEGENQYLSLVTRLFPKRASEAASEAASETLLKAPSETASEAPSEMLEAPSGRSADPGIPVIQPAAWLEEQPPPERAVLQPQPFSPGRDALAVRTGFNALQPMMLDVTQQAIAPVPASQSRIVVDLSDRHLTLQREGYPDQQFPIAVGRIGWETPVGEFEVINKQPHPTWQNPLTREVVPAGPDNPLGTRWIGFWTDGRSQLGFHGTNEPELIGQAISHGCIRMADRHIQELYAHVEVGTSVSIQF